VRIGKPVSFGPGTDHEQIAQKLQHAVEDL